ncbi:hypothetical protein [Hydrogenimonas sp.]
MENIGLSNADLMARIQVDILKKAMEVEREEVLSTIRNASSSPEPSPSKEKMARLTGKGSDLDLKG